MLIYSYGFADSLEELDIFYTALWPKQTLSSLCEVWAVKVFDKCESLQDNFGQFFFNLEERKYTDIKFLFISFT